MSLTVNLTANPPTMDELSEAVRCITDPTRPDARLHAICGGDNDRMGVIIAVAALWTLVEMRQS